MEFFAFGVSKLFEVIIQSELSELVLEVHPEVHIFDRVDDDVDELHARHHELDVKHFKVHEVFHERLEASLLAADVFEAVERRQNDFVPPLKITTTARKYYFTKFRFNE